MLRPLIVGLLFCLTSTIANSQSFTEIEKKIPCAAIEVVMTALASKDINEKPIWIGADDGKKSEYALFVNESKKTFTLIHFTNKVACIIGFGEKSTLFELKGNGT